VAAEEHFQDTPAGRFRIGGRGFARRTGEWLSRGVAVVAEATSDEKTVDGYVFIHNCPIGHSKGSVIRFDAAQKW
jgi:hypothetical protein